MDTCRELTRQRSRRDPARAGTVVCSHSEGDGKESASIQHGSVGRGGLKSLDMNATNYDVKKS